MADNSTSSLPFTERQSNRGTNLQFGIVHSVPISHNVPVARLKSSQKSHRSPQQRAPTAATLRSRTPPSSVRTPNKAASAAQSHPATLRFARRTNSLRRGGRTLPCSSCRIQRRPYDCSANGRVRRWNPASIPFNENLLHLTQATFLNLL